MFLNVTGWDQYKWKRVYWIIYIAGERGYEKIAFVLALAKKWIHTLDGGYAKMKNVKIKKKYFLMQKKVQECGPVVPCYNFSYSTFFWKTCYNIHLYLWCHFARAVVVLSVLICFFSVGIIVKVAIQLTKETHPFHVSCFCSVTNMS